MGSKANMLRLGSFPDGSGGVPNTSDHQQRLSAIPKAGWRLSAEPDIFCGRSERLGLGRELPLLITMLESCFSLSACGTGR